MKVRKLKVKKSNPASSGLRKGYIEFKGEKIPIHALNYKQDRDIMTLFEIEKLNAELTFFTERSKDKSLTPEAKDACDKRVIDIMWRVSEAANGAAIYKTMKCVERPLEWFDTLSNAELTSLTITVSAWLMHVDIDELYMEMFKEALYTFEMSKKDSAMTGKDVADILHKMENEYLTLKKKPKSLDIALRSVKARIVEDANKSLIPGG